MKSRGIDRLHLLASWAARVVPLVLLVLLAAAPFLYRGVLRVDSVRLTKVGLLVAFSGQLQARGNDLLAATQLAFQQADGHSHTIVALSALDDQARPQTARDQALGVAADPAVHAVLCCTTSGSERAVAAILPAHDTLRSLAATTANMPAAEAALARRQIGGRSVAIISDRTNAGEARASALESAFQAHGYAVTSLAIDFATGTTPQQVAIAVGRVRPDLVVFDMQYPAAAIVGVALRGAAVGTPILGDDRLDGAPAAALLGALGPVWYVALDRAALLQRVPPTFAGDFSRLRGHQPSSRDIVAYLEARAAIGATGAPLQNDHVPVALYQLVSGVYPGRPLASSGGATP